MITSSSIKINAHFEVPVDTVLELGQDCLIALEGTVTASTEAPDDAGGICQYWRIKACKGNVVSKQGTPAIVLKDKTRCSVKMRSLISHVFGLEYESTMNKILANAEAFQAFIESL